MVHGPTTPTDGQDDGAPSRGTWLVVDDEAPLRTALSRILTRSGWGVVVAADGEEGLALVGTDGPFDGVFCDLNMPRVDGWSFVEELRARGHATPVVLMSGDPAPGRDLGPGVGWLGKPFGVSDVAQAALDALDQGSGPQARGVGG